jgi:hypothetical protein
VHKVTFFPVGNHLWNGDCCRIDLEGGQKLLFDYCHQRNPSDANDRRINLPAALKDDLLAAQRLNYDVVAFTHLDDDHIHGATDFFHLRHSKDHQSSGRVKIDELWVPAAVIVEDRCDGEASLIQDEARYRLKQKSGIRVFSYPAKLESWLQKQSMTLAEVKHLITDAGQLVDGWTKADQGVEFFAHSPFAARQDDGQVVDRNNAALFLQATFLKDWRETRLLLTADLDSAAIEEIVRITRDVKKRPERLGWDINNVPHHSSYRSLNRDDKGTDETEPAERVDWLYKQGGNSGYLVSTSRSVPSDENDDQPPHRQAVRYYKKCAKAISGEYRITMEYPTAAKPDEMIFEITGSGATLRKRSMVGAAAVIGTSAPRAGSW